LLGSGVYGSVYLANDVLTQKQVACKIVDLRRKAVEPDGHGTPLDGAHKKEVQAFAEQEKGVSQARKKLIREIEILSKLSHVRVNFSSGVVLANFHSQILLLSTKLFVHLILCKLAWRDTDLDD
jgi:serine/threonine protein kinase